jgi:chromosome partitioning protein
MAQESLKPIFELTSQDHVIGAHYKYVKQCEDEFQKIGRNLIKIWS